MRAASMTFSAPGPRLITQASNFSCRRRSADPAEVTTASMPNCRKHSVSRNREDSFRSTSAARAATFLVEEGGARAGAVPKALCMSPGPGSTTKVYCGAPRGRWKDPKGQGRGTKVSLPGLDWCVRGFPVKGSKKKCSYSSLRAGSRRLMAACFVVSEPDAIRTCSRIARRSCRANFLRSASASGVNGPRQRLRIAAVISSIRASVDEGTGGFYGMLIVGSIQYIPDLAEDKSPKNKPPTTVFAKVLGPIGIRAISSYSPSLRGLGCKDKSFSISGLE